jgi:Ulp1 family protease
MVSRLDDMQQQYHRATAAEQQQQFACGILLKSMACLQPGECINATVLSEYMKLLMRKAGQLAAQGRAVKVHIFLTPASVAVTAAACRLCSCPQKHTAQSAW